MLKTKSEVTGVLQYHDRYCGIWVNMSLSSIS